MPSFRVVKTTQNMSRVICGKQGVVSFRIRFLYLGALNKLGRKKRVNTILYNKRVLLIF